MDFKPGLYRHYKGALYRAIALVAHHETQELMVLYVPLEHPESRPQVREFDNSRADSWNDLVDDCGCKLRGVTPIPPGTKRRFEYVQP